MDSTDRSSSPLQAPRPEASRIAKVVGFFRCHGRFSPHVGSKDSRDVSWWAQALSRALDLPLTCSDVRTAMAADARIRLDQEGLQTNVKGRQTLVAAGVLNKSTAATEGSAGRGAK